MEGGGVGREREGLAGGSAGIGFGEIEGRDRDTDR